jgi:DNA primase
VFSKRRTLFGLDAARQATRGGQRVVVVEGYMDVIALHQAGFTAAVAPLGTALTEEQLAELWRLSPAPVLCFDGDAAGGRAAARAADLALPLLTPEHTLSFAALPNGEDPDTLVRRGGAAAFRAALDSARPLIDALFHFIRDAAPDTSTPEQFESFKRRLDAAAGKIRDRGLAGEYRTALRDRLYEARRASRRGAPPARPIRLPRPVPAADGADAERCRILVAIVLRHPGLLHDVEEPFGHIDLPAWLSRLRAEILQWSQTAEALDSAALITHLTQAGLEAEVAQAISTVRAACAEPDAQLAEAEDGWWQFFGLLNRDGLEQEVEAARLEFERRSDPASERRLVSLRRAQLALFSCEQAFDIE